MSSRARALFLVPYLSIDRQSGEGVAEGLAWEAGGWQLGAATIRADAEAVVMQRPPFATQPLFFARIREAIVASPSWLRIVSALRNQGSPPSENPGYVEDYLRLQCPFTEETLCRQISLLRNGERVRIGREGVAESHLARFDRTPLPESAEPPDLELEISRPLRQIEDTVFHLSSGLDSSLLVLLARQLHPDATIHVGTCRTRGRGATQELDAVERLADEFRLTLHVVDLESVDLWDVGEELIRMIGYPIAHPSHLVAYGLDRALARDHRRIVTGRGPDEILAGYPWHADEFAVPEIHFARLCCTRDEVLRTLFAKDVLRLAESRAAINHRALCAGPRLSLATRLQYDCWSIFEAWNILRSAMTEGLGVEFVEPFLQRDLMASLALLPDRFKISGGTRKKLLRDAFKHLYPDYLLNAPKMGLTIDLREYFLEYSSSEILRRIYDDSEFGMRYLERSGCEKLIEDTLSARRNQGWQIWSLFLCSVAVDHLGRGPLPSERLRA